MCPNMEFSAPYFPAFGLNAERYEVSLRIQSKRGKIRTRKNSVFHSVPGHNQRIIYNGHKHIHALKFQSIVAPNGLIANLFGPVEGCRHDSTMLAISQIYPQMQQLSRGQNGQPTCTVTLPSLTYPNFKVP